MRTLYQREGRKFVALKNGQAMSAQQGMFDSDMPIPDGLPALTGIKGIESLVRGLFMTADKILKNSDLAVVRDRILQQQMRNDPDIMSPLLQRQLAVSLLKWDLDPVDPDDQAQVDAAQHCKQQIERIHDWTGMIRHMLEALWWGQSGAGIHYKRDEMGAYPFQWFPFHGDSLVWNSDGSQMGFLVNGSKFEGDTVRAVEAQAHMLEHRERAAFIVHTFNTTAADYFSEREARYPFSGRGLRDILYYIWLVKHKVLQQWVTWLERVSLGNRIGTYPSGNARAKSEMEKALANLEGDVSVLIPRIAGQEDLYSIDFVQAPDGSGGASAFEQMMDRYLTGRIKETILGQSATTEAVSTGLGSSVATEHANTFRRLNTSDAIGVGETLTRDLVTPVYRMNHGDAMPVPRFKFAVEDVNVQDWIGGVEKFVELGGDVKIDEARRRLGLEEPEEGDDVLTKLEDPFDQMGFDFGGNGQSRALEDAGRLA